MRLTEPQEKQFDRLLSESSDLTEALNDIEELMAEELALNRYGLDFYSLGNPRQQEVFADASVAYWDKVASVADGME